MPVSPVTSRSRVVVVVVAALVLLAALVAPGTWPGEGGSGHAPAPVGPREAAAALADAPPGSALAQLRSLRSRAAGGVPRYERARFGAPWSDVDGNGCDTRNDVLARDLVAVRGERGTCVLLAGTLLDPYSGETVGFVRGASSGAVQVDHVVALSDAWRSGAAAWPRSRRLAFANDPLNLLAVEGSLNEEKSGSDASAWVPPDPAYRCPYVARQIAVKSRYELSITEPERRAMIAVLLRCA